MRGRRGSLHLDRGEGWTFFFTFPNKPRLLQSYVFRAFPFAERKTLCTCSEALFSSFKKHALRPRADVASGWRGPSSGREAVGFKKNIY